jgi:hypothetical protein
MGIVHSNIYNRTYHGSRCAAASLRGLSEHGTSRIKHLESRRFEVKVMGSNCNSSDNYLPPMGHDQRHQPQIKSLVLTAAENARDQILHTRAQRRGFSKYWVFVISKTTHALEYAARTDWLYDECKGFAGFSDIA